VRPRTAKYYFGRLNVVSGGSDKLVLLTTALSSKAVLEVRGQRWGFYEFSRLEDLMGPFLTGYLVKYRPEDEDEVVVPENHTLAESAVRNRVTAKCRFFLHARTGLLAYHPIAGQIPKDAFTTRFVQVFKHAMEDFFVDAEILPIGRDYELLEQLARFTAVHEVAIALRPSNPSSRDIWKRQDERIRELNATCYREKIEIDPRKGTLNVADDGDIRAKIAMAQDGYGRADVTGQLDGREQTISTKDNPVTIILSSYDDEHPEHFLPEIREMVVSLMERFKQ
jgi:hypothetical protein